jgi:hypothetical protein
MSRPFQNELQWYDQPEEIIRRNGGFSGCDIDLVVRLPATYDRRGRLLSQSVAYQLGSIQTLSYQSYNSKEAVRSLGFKNVRGYARGSRTIAGTLMLNQLYTHVLDDVGTSTILNDTKGILTYSSGSIVYVRNVPLDPKIREVVGETYDSIESPSVINRRHNFDFSWDQNTIGRQLKSSDLPPFDIIAIFVNEYGHVGKMVIYGVDLVTEGGVLSIEDIYTEVSMQYVARDIEYFHSETQAGTSQWRGVSPFGGGGNRNTELSFVMDSMGDASDRVWRSVYGGGDAAGAESLLRVEEGIRANRQGFEGNSVLGTSQPTLVDISGVIGSAQTQVGNSLDRSLYVTQTVDVFNNTNTLTREDDGLNLTNLDRIRSLITGTSYLDNIETIIGDTLRFTTIRILYDELELERSRRISYENGGFSSENSLSRSTTPLPLDTIDFIIRYLIDVDYLNTIGGSGG